MGSKQQAQDVDVDVGLQSYLDTYHPLKRRRIRIYNTPWIDDTSIKFIKKREGHMKDFRQTGDHRHLRLAKQTRLEVNKES